MSAQAELQKAIFGTVTGSSSVMALVDGFYDRVSEDAFRGKQAYISFGSSDVVDDDADCIVAGEHTLQIDVWCRQVGLAPCKKIVDAVKSLLHEAEIELETMGLVEIRCSLRRVFTDADGLTGHGVLQFSAFVEEEVYD
ncbi:DUF3168 domain-containing protein [Rhizobium sp. 768_B6_N1_8]|uniref:DUF3168 domain-containing protein n=1 Tax=unclassified Rhizobium TaxID=2613769 RepID=UPI003F20350B